jgi:hypothetical protein
VPAIKLAGSELTCRLNTSKLVSMAFARSILPAVLTIALGAYAVDCSPTATAEQAMQCCNSMRCMSRHHHWGEECCKTMTTVRADIGQPTTTGISFAPIVFEIVQVFGEPAGISASAQSHAPPLFSMGTILPLRI